MKVYVVYEEGSVRDVSTYKIIKIFKTEKDANAYHEELIGKYKKLIFYIEEHELIE